MIKKIDLNYSSENLCLLPTFKMKWTSELNIMQHKYFFDISGLHKEK